MIEAQWQLIPEAEIPAWLLAAVAKLLPETTGKYAAQLLWQRGIRTPEELPGFLNPDNYQPTSAFAFGQEMKWAVKRIIKARENQEKVTIWGDFDADGVTSTSVLWEGLGQFLTAPQQLDYYVPNRLTESHGLNQAGIAKLASQGTQLIITCDTGSNNLLEIAYAKELGIDIIITDHHTLPAERPDVVAIINPRYFAQFHPLYHLAGVAVAYKLVEAMYASLPHVPTQPLEELLDLVAIGLIADLVELKGDCRYLAQIGIRQLKKQTNSKTASRPGVAHLLRLCRKAGDRPTDIGFGIGPRINAVSRIQGDASFCIELLTSRDEVRCRQLAEMAELANTRRKSLQNETLKQVEAKLSRLDLSTTQVIVLDDPQWQAGVLGLVASRIAQIYGRPTILLNTESQVNKEKNAVSLARGSARSVNSIDLYELVNSQANLLDKFGGHPYAAGLSLPLENLSLFRDGINQQFWQKYRESKNIASNITADLIITVNDLGASLFKELNLLEPYGMGNPVPKLLIKNCWFTNVWHKNIQDLKNKKIKYIRTHFLLWDNSVKRGFPGVWWEHYQHEIPVNTKCDVIVELDYNSYTNKYEVRLIALRKAAENYTLNQYAQADLQEIIDWRGQEIDKSKIWNQSNTKQLIRLIEKCPHSWQEIQLAYNQAKQQKQKLALAYSSPELIEPETTLKKLIGIVKYLVQHNLSVESEKIQANLKLNKYTFHLALQVLENLGFSYWQEKNKLLFKKITVNNSVNTQVIRQFLSALAEVNFKQQYFYEISLETIVQVMS